VGSLGVVLHRGPYKFLSELGLCAIGAEAFFTNRPVGRAVSFFKFFPLMLYQPRIGGNGNEI
jgi:hypothetical protein